ncbi:MAG: HipA N-terminal domain-containing protein [Candidatus Krumholzibacteriia bacterium]
MREASVRVHGEIAAVLAEVERGHRYVLRYVDDYTGPPVSLALPVRPEPYAFDEFPPFFDGLLPEGSQLEALLRRAKLDADDHLGQLLAVGGDLVGAVTVSALEPGGRA